MIPLTINRIGEIMSLNLGFITNDAAEAEEVNCQQVIIDMIELENDLNNYCNAIEMAEKAKATGSAEVIAFTEDLLGVSCEELIGGLGYKDNTTERRLGMKLEGKLDNFAASLSKLAKSFWNLSHRQCKARVQITFVKLPPAMATAAAGYEKLNGKTVSYSFNEACAICEEICKEFSSKFKQAINSKSLRSSSDYKPGHAMWRNAQRMTAFCTRLLKTMEENLNRTMRASNAPSTSHAAPKKKAPAAKAARPAAKSKKSDDFNW
jgi:hypothetical protein